MTTRKNRGEELFPVEVATGAKDPRYDWLIQQNYGLHRRCIVAEFSLRSKETLCGLLQQRVAELERQLEEVGHGKRAH